MDIYWLEQLGQTKFSLIFHFSLRWDHQAKSLLRVDLKFQNFIFFFFFGIVPLNRKASVYSINLNISWISPKLYRNTTNYVNTVSMLGNYLKLAAKMNKNVTWFFIYIYIYTICEIFNARYYPKFNLMGISIFGTHNNNFAVVIWKEKQYRNFLLWFVKRCTVYCFLRATAFHPFTLNSMKLLLICMQTTHS